MFHLIHVRIGMFGNKRLNIYLILILMKWKGYYTGSVYTSR
uniref:ORF40e n=1 Tax=Pinus koraiensis TaxID=88728 RepID=A4QM07_PINKO|nr:ORF40e [Pinus koraiensis]